MNVTGSSQTAAEMADESQDARNFVTHIMPTAGSPNINNNNQGLSTQHETAHCDQLGSSILLPF